MIKKHPLISFVALTVLMTWGGLFVNIMGIFPAFGQWFLYGEGHVVAILRTRQTLLNWTPNIAAVIVLGVSGGWPRVRELLGRFLKWRVGMRLWLWAVLIPFMSALGAVGLYGMGGGRIEGNQMGFIPLVLCQRFIFSLSTESIGGEAGWRGFVLVYLQQRFSPFISTLIVGLIWGLVHFPILTVRGFVLQEFFFFGVTILCLSVVLTWFYNRTRGSLLVAAFVHAVFNAIDATISRSFVALMPRGDYMFVLMMAMMATATVLIVRTKGRLGLA
ncbi:MAG: hypothetical protein A3G91_01775 [Omnitrophica WOR_2 bacterium RIFCSPLOWO2_12_FULL_50_9]|nr:MAG: hypothetical protein A3D87_03145 [Omnitrophica WOR_2 bacterium RIFCSPHIGHO2_02_FULL_50_17]OGX41215.1 MAG: hypothetical protein A3G91_01775 [Omnitrophica WOR_2 bacterium RIFCSPLOWO2_12_FULL_50_9]